MNCKNTLNEYIFDFLTKSSLKNTAAAFAQDAHLDRDKGQNPIDGSKSKENNGNQNTFSKVVDTPQGFCMNGGKYSGTSLIPVLPEVAQSSLSNIIN